MPFGGLLTMGAISGGSQIFGSLFGANRAAKAQKAAALQAQQTQEKYYQQGREALSPYTGSGSEAMGYMRELIQPGGWAEQQYDADKFAQDPGYAFRKAEGEKSLANSAAARGSTLSGGALKSLAGYSQGLASQEYGAAYSRWNQERQQRWSMLSGVAGMGQQAAGTVAQLGANAANQIGGAQMGSGNAQAAASMAIGNSIGNAGTSIANMYMMDRLFGQDGGAMNAKPTGVNRLAPWSPQTGVPSQGLAFLTPDVSPPIYSGGYRDPGYNPPYHG